jgi:PAS domain S-box-containing protein
MRKEPSSNIIDPKIVQVSELTEDTPLPTFILDKSRIVGCNSPILKIFGFQNQKEVLNRSIKNILSSPSFKKLLKFVNDEEDIPPTGFEVIAIKKDGSKFEALIFLIKISSNQKSLYQLALIDISDRQEQFRRLSRSEHIHREIMELNPDGIVIISEGKIAQVNDGFMRLLGNDSAEGIIGDDYFSIIEEGDRDRVVEAFHKFEKKKTPSQSIQFNVKRKDGAVVKVLTDWMRNCEIEKSGFIAYHRDVTEFVQVSSDLERKKIETGILNEIVSSMDYSKELHQILHSGLMKLLDLVHAESGGVFLLNGKDKVFNLEIRRNLADDLIAKVDRQTMEEGIGGFLTKTLEAHIFDAKKYPSYLPYGKMFKELLYVSVAFIPLIIRETCNGFILICSKKAGKRSYPSKDFFGILGREIGSAINNAQTYRQLRTSESELRQLVESVPDVLYEGTVNGAFRYISPMVEKLVNYSPKEFYRNPNLWLSLVHPDDKKYILNRNANIDLLGERLKYEYRVLPKGKATYKWVLDLNVVLRSDKGEVTGINGVITDVTNYKGLSEELARSNELNTSILSSIREGVVVYNHSMLCIQWNDAMEEMTGLRKNEVLGKAVSDIFLIDPKHDFGRLIQSALQGEVVTSEEFPYKIRNSEKEIVMWGRYAPLRDSQHEIIGAVGILTDVSERKVFERELKESEQVLRNVIDTMGDILMITDLKGNVIQVNKAFLANLGFTRQEVIGFEFPYPWLVDEEMGRYVLWIATLREKNMLHDFDMTWKSKDGKSLSMSLSTTLLRNSLGEPIAMVNIARDISERKRLMRDLENRNKQVELFNRIISAGNQSMDFDEIFSKIQKEISAVMPVDNLTISTLQPDGKTLVLYAALGASSKQKGKIFDGVNTMPFDAIQARKPIIVGDLSDGKYRETFSAHVGMKSKITLPILLKDRILGTFSIASTKPHIFTEHHVAILESIMPQIGAIMDRLALFRQVSEDASYIHNLLDSIDSVVYTIDSHYRILEVNKAWYEFIHQSGIEPRKDYEGVLIFDALPDESLKVLFQSVGSDILAGVVRFFSQEFIQQTPTGTRIYQLTMNPMVIDRKITGLVISHSDITALKESELALKTSNEQYITLNEISALQSNAHSLKEILSTTIPLLRKMIGADAAMVSLVSRGGTKLEIAQQVGFSEDTVAQLPNLMIKGSVTGVVVGTKEPVYISNVDTEHPELLQSSKALLTKEGIESLAIIPLASKDEVFGALDAFYYSRHNFIEPERQLLTLIGNQLGTAIENAYLYKELRSQIERLTVLYEFSEQLTSKLDINQIYEVVYSHVARMIPFKNFSINLFNGIGAESVSSRFVAESNDGRYNIQSNTNQTRRIGTETPDWRVFETRRAYHDENFKNIHVPMFSKESIIGVMAVEANEGGRYTDVHLRLLESIGNLTAIALEKGKLYEETVQKSIEIEHRNRELDDFTYVVSHDLKEPLISVEGFSKILQLDYRDLLSGDGKEYLDSITGASVRMKALIDDLLMLSRVSRPSESFKEVDVNKVLLDIENDMEFTIRQRNVDFVIPQKLPIVLGHETQVKIVFRNLIGNALKFNKSMQPKIEIGFQNAENNCYLFYIRDNGIGIEKEFHEKIFVIFQRLHRREDYEGTGAGLAIVKKIIELHKGKIWVESEPGKGSTFYFTFPQYFVN